MNPDPISRSTPSAAGVDARGLLAFLDVLEQHPDIRPHGLVVLRNGARIAEGWWAPYARDRVQLLYSLSKSFTSTAAGIAVQEGLLDLDATVLSYFPEYDADIRDRRSRAMTVRHIASMASGHRGDTIGLAEQADPDDLVRGFLLTPPDAEPGTLFAYNQPCTYSLAAIIQRRTGQSLVDYLRPRLFDPLGIGEASWLRWPPHGDLGFSGLHATTDAVARLGELYRRRGMWGERRLVAEAWIDEATRAHVPTPVVGSPDWEQGYGFQFWIARHGYRGDGAYGQFCVVVPEHGLVVAITSETEDSQAVLDALWTHVLPALDAQPDPRADEELATRLTTLRLPTTPAGAAPSDVEAWSGRTFATHAPGSRRAIVESVRLTAAAGGSWRLALVQDGETLEVPLIPGSWAEEEVDGIPVAVTGGWTDAGGLTADVLLLDTPHTVRVQLSPDGTATAVWLTEPLHSGRLRDQRRP